MPRGHLEIGEVGVFFNCCWWLFTVYVVCIAPPTLFLFTVILGFHFCLLFYYYYFNFFAFQVFKMLHGKAPWLLFRHYKNKSHEQFRQVRRASCSQLPPRLSSCTAMPTTFFSQPGFAVGSEPGCEIAASEFRQESAVK